ncbi:NIPA-like protein 2 isoform X2 [Rattus norvegicus]|uniref:NIPA-like protein 2 isoform X2 n=1 Tax=Rattus norvegicus TaxID=10116 RepID=UPI0003D0C176|nr:NIPA-like protein 2 isoform X1 [Rattus norvegicus]|eukprot:XP_006241606.1 PREDICTED: NIPA-like protein 2 isoform X1 [Rattus norvegicus]
MASPAPTGPQDDASAVLDELSRNFTYWAPGPSNGSLSSAWYHRNQIHLFGVLLAILGNLVISISLNIQKYSHLHLAQKEHPKPYFKSVLWLSGVLLMAIGETGNFAAYGVAPITLIAPLGCVSVTGSAVISVIFLKENLRASDLLGMTLAFAGTYLLVNFAPNITQAISARTIQYYFVGWQFLVYMILEILVFCILLYFHKRKGKKHIVILLTLVALLGIIFYQEFLGAAFLTVFIYLFGCFLSFLGVFLVTRNREREYLQQSFIDFGNIPGKQMLDKIQPDSNGLSYGSLPDGGDSTRGQRAEKKEA